MRRPAFLPLCALLLSGCTHQHVALDDLDQQSWTLASGEAIPFHTLLGKHATVFITLDPECPFSQAYTTTLDSLDRAFGPQGITFVGFYPGSVYERNAVVTFAARSGMHFRQVMDPGCALANAMQARVTPEAFVVDTRGRLRYHGAIDDSAVRAGRKKPVAAQQYLRDALQALVNGQDIAQEEITAVGCIVECR